MTTFWKTVLAASVAQSITFILYQGFIHSWLGIRGQLRVKQFFDWVSKPFRKYLVRKP